MIELVALKSANFRKGTQMKIQNISNQWQPRLFLALAATPEHRRDTRIRRHIGGTGSSTTSGSTTIRPGVNSGHYSSAASPAQPGTWAPANPQTRYDKSKRVYAGSRRKLRSNILDGDEQPGIGTNKPRHRPESIHGPQQQWRGSPDSDRHQ